MYAYRTLHCCDFYRKNIKHGVTFECTLYGHQPTGADGQTSHQQVK